MFGNKALVREVCVFSTSIPTLTNYFHKNSHTTKDPEGFSRRVIEFDIVLKFYELVFDIVQVLLQNAHGFL